MASQRLVLSRATVWNNPSGMAVGKAERRASEWIQVSGSLAIIIGPVIIQTDFDSLAKAPLKHSSVSHAPVVNLDRRGTASSTLCINEPAVQPLRSVRYFWVR